MLKGKKILLGVTGSIAAYKISFLVRDLIKLGAEVKIIMTSASLDFVTPVTLSTLSKQPVITDYYLDKNAGQWVNHVELGLWADLMLIAPASANTLAKMNKGVSDNVLLTTYLSARCPVWVAPAMDLDMYAHSTTQKNLDDLNDKGVNILYPTEGELASGLSGKGRMQEPENMLEQLQSFFEPTGVWVQKTVLITAGPTYEPIDPVRFIGNHSSGKMGFAIAEQLAELGSRVILITGPTQLTTSTDNIYRIDVKTAAEMYDAVSMNYDQVDVAIFSAAVSDYRVGQVSNEKIKKSEDTLNLNLIKNVDIAFEMGQRKSNEQINIGFALETNNEEYHAKGKLSRKNFDAIVLNSLNDVGAGFGVDTNKISILSDNKKMEFGLMSKRQAAEKIVHFAEELLDEKNNLA